MKTWRKRIGAVPTLCWMGVLVGCPLMYILVLSFMTRAPGGAVVYRFTMENYARIFDTRNLYMFGVSIGSAVLTSVLALAVGYPFAYFTARLRKRRRVLVLLLVMIPFWTSSLLRTYGWILILQRDGVLNNVLTAMRLIEEPLRMMPSFGAVQLVTVYMLLPFMILPIYNAVDRMDKSLPEASRDLGAKRGQTFWRVTLPLTMPGIVGGVSLVFISSVGMFFVSDLMGGAKVRLLGNMVRDQFTSSSNLPFGAALSVVMMLGVLMCLGLYAAVSKDSDGGIF